MYEVERLVAIIKPTEELLEWLHKQPGSNQNLSLDNLRRDCTTLLIPAFEGPNQAKAFIKNIYAGLFESELASWGLTESQWPEPRTFKMFNEWFNVEFHSVVYDIGDLDNPIK